MGDFFWIGAGLGAVLGIVHMLQVLATRLGQPGLSTVKTLWQAACTLLLWTVFGAYVLAFFLIGSVLLGFSRLFGSAKGTP